MDGAIQLIAGDGPENQVEALAVGTTLVVESGQQVGLGFQQLHEFLLLRQDDGPGTGGADKDRKSVV